MKLRCALLTALVLALLIPAGFAHASAVSGDPSVIINRSADPSGCGGSGQPICYSGGVLSLSFSPSTTGFDFEYVGTTALTSMTIEFQGTVGDSYSCSTDIFYSCSTINTGSSLVEFLFSGGTGGSMPCQNNGSTGGQCLGEIQPPTSNGATFFGIDGTGFTQPTTVTVSPTPEPATFVLLFTGLGPLIGFGRRRWLANRTA